MNGIEFKSVSKRYGPADSDALAVNAISFVVPQGSLTTLLGPSGCGKTTTLRMIAGLETPSAGEIWIGGHNVTALGPTERNVSMMFQSYALFPHLRVIDNVMFGLKMTGVPLTQAQARAREALRNVGLVGFDTRWPTELSGGQQQRVALARALVLEPAVLLFDEPLSNLDARLRREMRDEIRSLQQRLGLTVAYVTHDQSEALAISDQIIVMNQGVIAQQGTPQALYAQPASAFVASFMGEAMLFDAQALHLPGTDQVAVRPEAWRIAPAQGDAAEQGDALVQGLAATLRKAAYLGSFYEYTFDTPLGVVLVVSPDVTQVLPLGAQVHLCLGSDGVSRVSAG